MSPLTPTLEALVGIGTLYQFFLERQPVDALELVATDLKKEETDKDAKRRGKWARVKAFIEQSPPPSRELARELSDVYSAGICDSAIPVDKSHTHRIWRKGHHRLEVVYFPEAQHVFESDKASLGWLILAIGTIGLPIVDLVWDLTSGAAWAGVAVLLIGLCVLLAWNSSVGKTLHRTYREQIRQTRKDIAKKSAPPANAESVDGEPVEEEPNPD